MDLSEVWSTRIWWMENTDARNAFYQVFEFIGGKHDGLGRGKRGVTVTHCGSLKISQGTYSRPVMGGKVNIKKFQYSDDDSAAYSVVLKKSKAGYKLVHSHSMKADSAWLNNTFGAENTHQILLAIGVTTANNSIDLPITPSEDVFSFDDLPEHAGSW